MIEWVNGAQEVKQKTQISQAKDNAASSKKQRSDQKKQKKHSVWKKKVSRYLAYCVNGGLLCSKFTLKTMIESLKFLETNQKDEIHEEISFLLYAHNRDKPNEYIKLLQMTGVIDPQKQWFNQNVMAVLIEDGYLREHIMT